MWMHANRIGLAEYRDEERERIRCHGGNRRSVIVTQDRRVYTKAKSQTKFHLLSYFIVKLAYAYCKFRNSNIEKGDFVA